MFDAYELNKLATYATTGELYYVAEAARHINPKTAVMLGAGPGVFALALYDWYMQDKAKLIPHLTVVDIKTCEYVHAHLSAMRVPMDHVKYWIGDSAEEASHWKSGRIGLLIVDADHSTEAVLRDIDAWFPHVAKGGLIFFHDYLERENGFTGTDEWKKGQVAAAIEQRQYLPWKLETEVGISVVYRKL